MTRLALILALLFGCSAATSAPLATVSQPMIGVVGADPNPLTFWWYAGDGSQLRPALECALQRIRAATCLPVDVSLDAHHWVRMKTAAQMGGREGWTTGQPDSTRIALKTPMGPQTNCRVLTHEIAEHTLRRRSDHAGEEPFILTEQLLESICSVQDCLCLNPETEENPVESTQAPCIDPFKVPAP